ncbi:MAG: hypothetical protein M1834_005075 [Cirrosporium novae-zelandiae]|nr:MAG: hypothetical protein M1834_005075 [Cirrosporium novae-zelandiae]
MADTRQHFKCIGIVGAGNMGAMMAFRFSEQGLDVSLWDVIPSNVDNALSMCKGLQKGGLQGKIDGFHDIHKFVRSLGVCDRKLFIFSITHGKPVDEVLEKIKGGLRDGDVVLDGGNEDYRNTERRQKELELRGVGWIGMGVSGGYQSARRGPSMSPGGERKAVEMVLPLLEKFAAKAEGTGKPCVANVGPRGSGHFVKMVHNGIENGMLSTICEAWSLLHKSLGLSNDDIGSIFEKWNAEGELKDTYLIQIGSEICHRRKTRKGDENGEGVGQNGYVLDDILDKVVQDDNGSEGTLYWTVMEAARRHVSAPTIATGHFLRVASGNRNQRLRVAEKLDTPKPKAVTIENKDKFIEDLRKAVYVSILCSFCQGMELIARASVDEGWGINLATCIKIWRAGCIIQEDYIANMLEPVFESDAQIMNLKLIDEVASALHENFPALRNVILKAVEWDAYVPSLSASLEYIKYEGGTMLPTQFMEAEMDFFGAHAYDRPNVRGEDPGKPSKGAHHYEWRAA